MGSSFGGIGVDLKQGQMENAENHFDAFNGRVQALIDQLGSNLKNGSPDSKVVGELSHGIGMES